MEGIRPVVRTTRNEEDVMEKEGFEEWENNTETSS